MQPWGKWVLATASVVAAAPVWSCAATAWNESTQGDLSGNRQAPTLIPLVPGDNDLIGTTQGGDVEYVRIDVPVGARLTGLVLKSYSGFDGTSFVGVQQGTTFSVDPAFAQPSNLYGYTHFGSNFGQVGTNILDDIGSGPGAQGFVPPLQPGSYTFWIQQLGSSTSYDLNYQLTLVPEPAVLPAALGAIALAGRRGRVRQGRGATQE
jgi:hypothetical protein